MSDIILPVKLVKSDTRNPKSFLLYAQPKCGKTTLLSKLENNLIIDLENGSDYVDALKVKASTIEELQAVGTAIVKAGKPYKYVTIDTVTALEELCLVDALKMYKEDPKGRNYTGNSVLDLPQGMGYYWLRLAFDKWMEKLKKLADHIIFVGHVKEKLIDKAGTEVSAKDIDLTGKLARIVSSKMDAIAYMYRGKDQELVLTFKSSEQLNCGSRCNHLKGQDIVIATYNQITNDLDNVNWNQIYLD